MWSAKADRIWFHEDRSKTPGNRTFLFYEKIDEDGYSSLVLWDDNGDIILPKRYHSYKHFTNLVKKGYKLIRSYESKDDVMAGAFKSSNNDKIILQIFNEGSTKDFSIDIPIGTLSIEHYITSNSNVENFKLVNDIICGC